MKNISKHAASDADLVNQYQQTHDLAVLGELFQRYMELTYGVCLKYLKHPENAQDSVMTIFEELIIKLRKHEVNNFGGWLYTLAKNHCLMRLRTEKKQVTVNYEPELMQSKEMEHLNDAPETEEDFRKMEYCMEQLQPEQKNVIALFYLEGKCYNDISAATGLEWNQVRSAIQNGRRNLKICMENQKEKITATNGPISRK